MRERIQAVAAAAVIVALLAAASQPRPQVLCEGFLPPNTLSIPVGDVNARGIEKDVFNAVLDRVEAVYAPIVAAQGGKLIVNRMWENGTVNASANQDGNDWHINMYGGLARHAAVTADGFALVACHELGHHIGGHPKMWGWATNEGGADYYSTLKCLRLVFPADKQPSSADPVAAAACAKTWPEGVERNLCLSGAMAGHSIASLFQALSPQPKAPAFGTPDPNVVTRTNNAHPKGQCRLDTYFQAALCVKPVTEQVSNTDEKAGACTQAGGFAVGTRPLCWYKPPTSAGEEGEDEAGLSARMPLPDAKAVQRKLDALAGALSSRGI
ncbi:MAG: hypothetical protein HY554_02755 [Elusimicrobia bacterium]|nr:hypothetical protein [Elusimicrobiota bacterium]